MEKFCSLDIRRFADKKANFHTHTERCQHAKGEEREYIEKAIEAGYQVLGFSDHAPQLFVDGHVSRIRMKMEEMEGYVCTLERLRKEYKNEIEIYIGLEMENFPSCFERTIEALKQYPLDYMILGQHYFDNEGTGPYVMEPTTDEQRLKLYVARVLEAVRTGYYMYVAHPDIFNFIGEHSVYDRHMLQVLDEFKRRNMPIEVNVNGYRAKCNYPNPYLIELGARNGNDFIIGADAHNPNGMVDFDNFDQCVRMVKQAGGKLLYL